MVKTLTLEQIRELMLDSEEAIQAYEDFDKELAITEKLYAMREHAGLSQRALAARLGINPSAINRLEKNPASASLKIVQQQSHEAVVLQRKYSAVRWIRLQEAQHVLAETKVSFMLSHPTVQSFCCTADFTGDGSQRCPLRFMLALMLRYYPHRTFFELRRVFFKSLLFRFHGSILSEVEASGNPEVIH